MPDFWMLRAARWNYPVACSGLHQLVALNAVLAVQLTAEPLRSGYVAGLIAALLSIALVHFCIALHCIACH